MSRRPGRRAIVAGALLTATLLLTLGLKVHERRTGPTALLRQAWALANAGQAQKASDIGWRLWRADPENFEAFAVLLHLRDQYAGGPGRVERDSVVRRVRDAELRTCMTALLFTGGFAPPLKPAVPATAHTPRDRCIAHLVLNSYSSSHEERERAGAVLLRSGAGVPATPRVLATFLVRAGQYRAALDVSRTAGRGLPFEEELRLRMEATTALHLIGEHDRAQRIEKAMLARARRRGEYATRVVAEALAMHGGLVAIAASPEWNDHYTQVADSARALLATMTRSDLDAWYALGDRLHAAMHELDRGRLHVATAQLDSVLRDADALGDERVMAIALIRRGRAYVKRGDPARAEGDLLNGLAAARRIADPMLESDATHNLLHLYESLERWPEAQAAADAYRAAARQGGPGPARMMSAHDGANLQQRLGRPDRAEELFQEMLAEIAAFDGQHVFAGEYHEARGDLDAARAAYHRSYTQQDEPGRSLAALVRLLEQLGDTAQSRRYAVLHDSALLEFRIPESIPLLPAVLARRGLREEALQAYRRARVDARSRGQTVSWAQLATGEAEVEYARGAHARAHALADSAAVAGRAAGAVEPAVRAAGLAAAAAAADGAATAPLLARLDSLTTIALAHGYTMLQIELRRRRARILLDDDRLADALHELQSLSEQVDSLVRRMEDPVQGARFRDAQKAISNTALEALLERPAGDRHTRQLLGWSIRRKARTLRDGEPAPVRDRGVREAAWRVAPREAVVDYLFLDESVAATVLRGDSAVTIRLPIAARDARALVVRLRAAVAPRTGSRVDLLRARWDSAAATALSAALLAPLAGHLDGVELLTIVPDGPLHVLPFDALPFGDAQVVDAFATRLLASLVDLNGASRPPPPGPIAIIGAAGGDGAAEAEREARLVARVLGVRRVRVLAGEQLTRQEVASALSGARLVHIAAHARTNDSRPEYAYLELHGGPGGRWHAREIERVALPDALVVLSACETAGGALLDTEGTLSLSRAFLRAGARATVATLWPIGAATEPLMETFYGALTPDRSVAEALRLARLELRSTHPHPFYWAPFVLTERRE